MKLANTVYVPATLGAAINPVPDALLPEEYVKLDVTLSMLDVVAENAEPVYVPPASLTLTVGAAWPIVNVALAEPLV